MISIVIPVYNAEDYLAARLEHLLQHDLGNVQIIVIDDGSTDNSYEICRRHLGGHANSLIIKQENQGLSIARNRGIEASVCEYIVFLDSDDILFKDGFTKMKAYLSVEKPDVLMGKYVIMQEKGRNIWPTYSFPTINSAAEARKYIYSEILDSVWHAWRYVCRRDFLLRHDLFFTPGIICEDMEWSPRVLRAADSIAFLDDPFYGYYYNRRGSITRNALAVRVADVNAIVACSVQKYIAEDYGKTLAYRLIRESFYSLSRYCLCKKVERKKLRPVIEDAIGFYHYSSSAMIQLFLRTRGFPCYLYLWSAALWTAKTARGLFKIILGPLSVKRQAIK